MSEEALEQDENRDLALQSNAAPQLPKPKQRLPAQRKRNLTLATLFFITVALIYLLFSHLVWARERRAPGNWMLRRLLLPAIPLQKQVWRMV